MYTLAIILELLGEIIIAISVVRVHIHLKKEHRLDKDVYQTITREQSMVMFGIVLLVASTILQLYLN